jgi:hypothetical protein
LGHDFVPLGTPLCGSSMEDVMPGRKIQREPSARDSLPLKSSTIGSQTGQYERGMLVHDGGAKTPREISAAMHLVTLFH